MDWGSPAWFWEEFGEEVTNYIIEGKEYQSRAEAINGVTEQGLSKEEAERFVDSLEVHDWGHRDLSYEEAVKHEKYRQKLSEAKEQLRPYLGEGERKKR